MWSLKLIPGRNFILLVRFQNYKSKILWDKLKKTAMVTKINPLFLENINRIRLLIKSASLKYKSLKDKTKSFQDLIKTIQIKIT